MASVAQLGVILFATIFTLKELPVGRLVALQLALQRVLLLEHPLTEATTGLAVLLQTNAAGHKAENTDTRLMGHWNTQERLAELLIESGELGVVSAACSVFGILSRR